MAPVNNHSPWNARKSTTLTLVVTWVALVFSVIMIPGLVPILKMMRIPGTVYDSYFVLHAAGPLYVSLFAGLVALVLFLRLIYDLRRDAVFNLTTVRRLRAISYCGFLIMVACVVGAVIAPPRPVFVLLAAVAGFLGLAMRGIKNVIDTARLLKEDADYTI